MNSHSFRGAVSRTGCWLLAAGRCRSSILAPAGQDGLALEQRDAEQHEENPCEEQTEAEEQEPRRRQPPRPGELRDEYGGQRQDDQDAELLRGPRIVDARRDDDG